MSSIDVWRNIADALVTNQFLKTINDIWETMANQDNADWRVCAGVQLHRWEYLTSVMMDNRRKDRLVRLYRISWAKQDIVMRNYFISL